MITSAMTAAHFTLDELEQEVRRLAAEQPDKVYEPQIELMYGDPTNTSCLYWHEKENAPGCIYGHALTNLGIPRHYFNEGEAIDSLLAALFGLTEADIPRWFADVQLQQDDHVSWSDAVREADWRKKALDLMKVQGK